MSERMSGYRPTAELRWREIFSDRLPEHPVLTDVRWGNAHHYILEQKWVCDYALRSTGESLPDLWMPVGEGDEE